MCNMILSYFLGHFETNLRRLLFSFVPDDDMIRRFSVLMADIIFLSVSNPSNIYVVDTDWVLLL